ncbi:MAG: ABC transporter ATP-binding protein [Candidatus Sumerlaeia bacterium]
MSAEIAISLKHVCKYHDRDAGRLRKAGKLLMPFKQPDPDKAIRAADDISLDVPRGQSLGVIGSNGAGKSSLLRLIAGISEPSSGSVEVHGKVLPLLELGAGFHPDLSGYENIFLQGNMLGVSRREMEALAPKIIEFAGIDKFIHMPVSHYSSGMYMRLGFAISAHLQPDILLIDEAFSVGDLHFTKKCVQTMQKFHERGGAFLLVSHSIAMIEQVCDEVIWMDAGRIVERGSPSEVGYLYRKHMFERSFPAPMPIVHLGQVTTNQEGRFGSGAAVFDFVDFIDRQGQNRWSFRNGDPMTIRLRYTNRTDQALPVDCVLAFFSCKGHPAWCITSDQLDPDLSLPPGSGILEFPIDRIDLSPGPYLTIFSLCRRGDSSIEGIYDMHSRIYTLTIQEDDGLGASAGLDPDCRWENNKPGL